MILAMGVDSWIGKVETDWSRSEKIDNLFPMGDNRWVEVEEEVEEVEE